MKLTLRQEHSRAGMKDTASRLGLDGAEQTSALWAVNEIPGLVVGRVPHLSRMPGRQFGWAAWRNRKPGEPYEDGSLAKRVWEQMVDEYFATRQEVLRRIWEVVVELGEEEALLGQDN